ncbi:MAG: NAD(P)/FAD-dependent oxidoreductase [Gammaproteobacteria bacterium]
MGATEFEVDSAVIGAGVIGLAVARELALAGDEVVVLEAASAVGTGTSSRNSEVIHAGIYYPTGSLKARLCVRGKQLLYDYCESRAIPHRRCGKLVVACDEGDEQRLLSVEQLARANGVEDLIWLSGAELKEREPELRGSCALFSPSTGIIDSHALMLALQGEAEDAGARVVLRSPVLGGECGDGHIVLRVGGEQPAALRCRRVVNSAGLDAPRVARSLNGLPQQWIPNAYFARGNYFALSGKSPFRHLIYPLPEPGGLGIHLTLDLAGQARFGPDVEWIKEKDYRVNEAQAGRFYAAIRRYWPGLREGALAPAYAGIRPKIVGPGEEAADFVIQGPETHGIAGLVNLFGIESPGLTACLAIAGEVRERFAS